MFGVRLLIFPCCEAASLVDIVVSRLSFVLQGSKRNLEAHSTID